MNRLAAVNSQNDIFPEYHNTPISLLLEYHNLSRPFDNYAAAQLLVGMCMDFRKQLRIPNKFSYIIRTGGGNLRYNEFQVSYAVAVGKVKHIALIGHSHCAMVNLASRKDIFIDGLVENAGWDRAWATDHFIHLAPMFEIGNEIDFLLSEAKRFRLRYPKIMIAPMYYKVEDNLLYLINE